MSAAFCQFVVDSTVETTPPQHRCETCGYTVVTDEPSSKIYRKCTAPQAIERAVKLTLDASVLPPVKASVPRKPRPTMPSLVRRAWNLTTAIAQYVVRPGLVTQEWFAARTAVCEPCELRDGNWCAACGCNLLGKAKARVWKCKHEAGDRWAKVDAHFAAALAAATPSGACGAAAGPSLPSDDA